MKLGNASLNINTQIIPLIVLIAILGSTTLTALAEQETTGTLAKAVGAALAVGFAGLGAGFAVGMAGSAAASGIVERREAAGLFLLIVVLGEGIAIYGLLIALLIILIL
ncbi:MAG: V-type ATP synthase subunit K [Thermoprotei archaeon]|nr:V-type ATP synthase subunit K [Thermoprotei archaeon]